MVVRALVDRASVGRVEVAHELAVLVELTQEVEDPGFEGGPDSQAPSGGERLGEHGRIRLLVQPVREQRRAERVTVRAGLAENAQAIGIRERFAPAFVVAAQKRVLRPALLTSGVSSTSSDAEFWGAKKARAAR